MKRLFDVILACFGIVIFSPLAFLFALLIKIEDKGPILYIQERWGMGAKRFKALKFRTMIPNADGAGTLVPAKENDKRVTRIGIFLRATAMDELPQLINIVKGDMSFVGPRAIAVQEITPDFPRFYERHQVRPGLTGPAQISVSRDATLEEKFRHDLDYIRTRSFGGDLKLIFLSFWITLRGRWESRQNKI
ncbi:MAG TPA: sugar transferase [bacterium]|nr:sugar transferase [bacterium]